MKKIALLLIILSATISFGQSINPGEDEIYREGEIAVVRLTMTSADKDFLMDDANVWNEEYLPVIFQFSNSLMDTTLTDSIGLRLRGNTSRTQPKRSFKLKFKEYDGEKFFGYKKFNLKAQNNDPSMIRELTTMQTFRKSNVPAARTHHAELYINDEYMGIYLNVEQIDDDFAELRFTYDEGNLYKCTWPATLEDDDQIYNNDSYELKTNKSENDRAVLANFVSLLNGTPDDTFEEVIETVFNVDSYLHYLAVEVLTGHWDGYSYNKNNYYLYEDNSTGLIEFIPYDVDNTFGIDWVDRDWGIRDVLDWTRHNDPRPLTSKILAREKYLYQYKNILDSLLKEGFTEAYFYPFFDDFKARLADPISRDTYFPLTFGFTSNEFDKSFTEQVIEHAPYGLKPYVTARTVTAREQIGTVTNIGEKELTSINVYPNPSSQGKLVITSDKQIYNLHIIDLKGQHLPFTITEMSGTKVDLDFSIPAGLYILQLNNTSQKLIVK